jgi:hypothetical protein
MCEVTELHDGHVGACPDPHRRRPVAGTAGDVGLGVPVTAQSLNDRLLKADDVVERPQLAAVSVPGQLQVHTGRCGLRHLHRLVREQQDGRGVVPAVEGGVEVRPVSLDTRRS